MKRIVKTGKGFKIPILLSVIMAFAMLAPLTAYAADDDNPPTYTLTIDVDSGGRITEGTEGKYEQGDKINIAAAARSGYRFYGWESSNGGTFGDAGRASTTFTMPGRNVTITARFYYIDYDAYISPSRVVFDKYGGADIVVRLYPGDYELNRLRYDTSHTMTRNRDYYVEANTYYITYEFLMSLGDGTHTITFYMDGGNNPRLTVVIADTTPPAIRPLASDSPPPAPPLYRPDRAPVYVYPPAVHPTNIYTPPSQYTPLALQINDANIYFYEGQPPMLMGGIIYVPVFELLEWLGYSGAWDWTTRSAVMTLGGVAAVITEGSYTFTVNGYAYNLSVPAHVINGTFMMPYGEILAALGCVAYLDADNVIHIYQ